MPAISVLMVKVVVVEALPSMVLALIVVVIAIFISTIRSAVLDYQRAVRRGSFTRHDRSEERGNKQKNTSATSDAKFIIYLVDCSSLHIPHLYDLHGLAHVAGRTDRIPSSLSRSFRADTYIVYTICAERADQIDP